MELPLGASTLSHKSIQDPFAKPRFPSVRDVSQQSWKDASALSCSPEGMGLWGGLGSDGTDGPDVDGREGRGRTGQTWTDGTDVDGQSFITRQ